MREDLPVGHNLQDHLMAQLNYETDEPSLFGSFTPENFERFEQDGTGPLCSNIPEAGAFLRTRPDLDAPDIQFHYAPSMFYDEGLTAPHDHGYCFGPVVIKPSSRGRVTLRDAVARLEAVRAVQLPRHRGRPALTHRGCADCATDR